MADFQLLPNESIILHNTNAYDGSTLSYHKDELILTTAKIVYKKNNAFGKTKGTLIIPLRNIRVSDNRAQAFFINNPSKGAQLQIYTKLSEEFTFAFYPNSRKDVVRWVNEINKVVTGDSSNIVYNESKEKSGTLGMFADAFKNAMGSEPELVGRLAPNAKKSTQKCVGCGAPVTGVVGQMARCEYCDMEQRIK